MLDVPYQTLKKRVNELEQLLANKGAKALIKHVAPQPLNGDNFQTYYAEDLLFKQLLKIHDANQKIDFDYTRAFGTDKTPDNSSLFEPLGELIILATSWLDKIGCNYHSRLILFEKLNRRNEND